MFGGLNVGILPCASTGVLWVERPIKGKLKALFPTLVPASDSAEVGGVCGSKF